MPKGETPPGQPHKPAITFSDYAMGMKNKLNATLKAALLAAVNTPPRTADTVRKVLIKQINGVKVVLQETEMKFSLN
jgi:hypothetical protein